MRPVRAGLELRVGLGGHVVRMRAGRQLDELHQTAVGRGAGDAQTGFFELAPIGVVDLVAVAVALMHQT